MGMGPTVFGAARGTTTITTPVLPTATTTTRITGTTTSVFGCVSSQDFSRLVARSTACHEPGVAAFLADLMPGSFTNIHHPLDKEPDIQNVHWFQ